MRIAPKEAPCSGYAFGKGIYTADLVGKSLGYTCYSGSNDIATFVLIEVACGNQLETTKCGNFADLPAGKHSTKFVHDYCPDPAGNETWFGDVNVPLGKVKSSTWMRGQEYIVYNTNQVKIRYLVRCKVGYFF